MLKERVGEFLLNGNDLLARQINSFRALLTGHSRFKAPEGLFAKVGAMARDPSRIRVFGHRSSTCVCQSDR